MRHELDGMFSKLIEPEQFRRIALPRLSEEERRRAPYSLQVILHHISRDCRSLVVWLLPVDHFLLWRAG